jgi:hypothetical protein
MIFEALLTPLFRGVEGVFFQNSIETSKLYWEVKMLGFSIHFIKKTIAFY